MHTKSVMHGPFWDPNPSCSQVGGRQCASSRTALPKDSHINGKVIKEMLAIKDFEYEQCGTEDTSHASPKIV